MEGVELTSNLALMLITMQIGSIPPNSMTPNTYLHSNRLQLFTHWKMENNETSEIKSELRLGLWVALGIVPMSE